MPDRLATGISTIDNMIQRGLPLSSCVAVQGPEGPLKFRVALAFLAEGLRTGASGLVVVFSESAESVLAELLRLGVDLDRVMSEGRLRIIDRHGEGQAQPSKIDGKGHASQFPAELLDLNLRMSHALASLRGTGPTRAVVESFSSIARAYGAEHACTFVRSAKIRFERLRVTSLFLVDKNLHSSTELSTLQRPFTGVIDFERTQEGNATVDTVGVLRMDQTVHDPTYRVLVEPTREAQAFETPSVGHRGVTPATSKTVSLCPVCGASVSTAIATCPSCGLRFVHRPPTEVAPGLPRPPPVRESLPNEPPIEAGVPEAPKPPTIPPELAARPRTPGKAPTERGFTNGLVLEPAPARPPGMTNGLGGRTNGLTNGIGRTNGLGRGVGKTNGLAAARPPGKTAGPPGLRRRVHGDDWRWYLIPLAAALILLIPFVYVPEPAGVQYAIQIDGRFADWAGASLLSQSQGLSLSPNVDLVRFGTFDNGPYLAFYAEVRGVAFAGGGNPPRYDTVRLFLDVDQSPGTGYAVAGIGADRMIEISGWGNRVNTTILFEWDVNRAGLDWNGWIKSTSIAAAVVGTQLELEVDWSLLVPQKAPIFVFAHFQSFDDSFDEADYVVSTEGPSVRVDEIPLVPETLQGSDASLLRLNLTAIGAPAAFSSVRVVIVGTAAPSSLSAIRLVDGVGTVLQEQVPLSRNVTFQFASKIIAIGATESLTIRGDVVGSSGDTLGVSLADARGIALGSGVGTLRLLPSSRAVGYVGSVPTGHRVDGAFSDWGNLSTDPSDSGLRVDMDLRGYAFERDANGVNVYMQVAGRVLQGVLVPRANTLADSAGSGTSSVDSDRDTVPDISDPMPYDFNNDGMQDAATNHDYDADGMTDYPFGSDFYLNTTIPSTYPPPYANGAVSLYIGPTLRPVLIGEDVARVYFDADNDTATGFRINVLGADVLLEIRGRDGVITSRVLSAFNGTSQFDWSWTPILAPAVATDDSRIEAEIPASDVAFANNSAAYFETMDWAQRKDGSTDPIFRIGPQGSPSSASFYGLSSSLGTRSVLGPQPLDIPGNQRWFFTTSATTGTSCTTNLAASTTAGASATSTTLSTAEAPICWFTPTNPPSTIAGPWEVILDITKTTDGTRVLSPDSNGDVTGWSAGPGCTGATTWACVDESPNDGDTSYIVSTLSATTDSLFNLFDWSGGSGAPPSPLTVVDIAVDTSCRKTAAPVVAVRAIIKSGGVTSLGPTSTDCANSATYSTWTDTWATDPSDGAAWTLADINALQIGVRDADTFTREVRVSHVVATVTFVPAYTVEVDHCTNAACTGFTTLYGPVNSNTYGSDVTFTTPSIPAQTFNGNERIRFRVQLNGSGTPQNHGSVTVRYNGPNPGTDDSRGTVALLEFGEVAIPIFGTVIVVSALGRAARARRRSQGASRSSDALTCERTRLIPVKK